MHIKVKVKTGAKKERFALIAPDVLAVEVKEKAERNMANKRVREIVAKHFSKPLSSVRLIKGHHSPSKVFHIAA